MTEEVKTMKYLLIRADDLGYSEGVNYGIAAAVAAGLVRSVGVMTNMPAAVHGLGLLHGHSLCLGQHTNICVGRPLTDPSHIPSLCTPEGEFRPSRTYREAAKEGRDFVVLDEATAYIDPENEAVVQQAVGKLVAGKTVLVIAHRLSTITGADQIVVVNGGRIQDAGTHEELLKNCPLYQEMWRAHMGAKEGEQA